MSTDRIGTTQINISGANSFDTALSFAATATASTLCGADPSFRLMITDINVEAGTATGFQFIKDVGGAASAASLKISLATVSSKFISLRNPITLATNTALGLTTDSTATTVFISGYRE